MVSTGLETDDLLQKATLYPVVAGASADGFGSLKVDKGVEIACRWRFSLNTKPDPQSNTVQTVTTVVVDREIPLGSILKRTTDKVLYEVTGYDEKWDVNAESARRTVTVTRWNGQLPEGV